MDALFPRAHSVEAGSWSQGGFALAIPLLQRSTASGPLWLPRTALLNSQQGTGHASPRMGLTPVSPLGKCLPTKQRQLEPSWPFSCRWAWPWELPSPSCSEFSSSRGTWRVQGHQETAPHPPPRPWTPQRCGEITPHTCPCQIALPQQMLRTGTVPLLQGWPGSCHAQLCDAFRPTCLLLPHAVCLCKTPGISQRSSHLPRCVISPAQGQKPFSTSFSLTELKAGIQCYSLSCPWPQGT